MTKKKKATAASSEPTGTGVLCATRTFDFPLGDALDLVKRRGGRSRLSDEERKNLRLHQIVEGEVFREDDYPDELVRAWKKNGLVAEPPEEPGEGG